MQAIVRRRARFSHSHDRLSECMAMHACKGRGAQKDAQDLYPSMMAADDKDRV